MLYEIAYAVLVERLGVTVATILGLVNLIWSGDMLLSGMAAEPGGIQAALYLAFPGYHEATLLRTTLNLIGNSVLLIGAFMSVSYGPRGHTVVRATSWIMIAAAIVGAALMMTLLIGRSAAWESLDADTRGGLIGGLVVGAIGRVLQWSVLLFLFRNRLPQKQAPQTP